MPSNTGVVEPCAHTGANHLKNELPIRLDGTSVNRKMIEVVFTTSALGFTWK